MSRYQLIVCQGHCGSKWLAAVLGNPPGVIWHHELRMMLTRNSWVAAAKYDVQHPKHDIYFDFIRSELGMGGYVGDSNSWPAPDVPQVHKQQPIGQIIYLIRHPVLQLHSLMHKSAIWQWCEWDHFVYDRWLRKFWLVYREYATDAGDYNNWSRHHRICLLVLANQFMPRWLQEQGLPVQLMRLEDLTTDVEQLTDLVSGIAPQYNDRTIETFENWQQIDINRKVHEDRSPIGLYTQWNDSIKRIFGEMCGEMMQEQGYTWLDDLIAPMTNETEYATLSATCCQ